ncbi:MULTISPECIES: AAA family ATPase [unclassified Streptomyces]|uniref:AAA family ATPase n=1 Tax=unclassified Streptomyces TaxID=2593676 RepID=UPI00225B443E|nr:MULTISPECIES: AAA family ATPase [unclassified Streptomyces]WSP57472.1 AAA family ATPase [Streptomyces sp. NBC_01241]WSU21791.1 AAA family ATPase [Streptomyces sp. NBC_01108]MCX4789324.1 AAA family ATPase [Streptomyces sp. NBC_01221]MCX4794948.1 AAA family ATPase [Streptomyces sp. NBC_01242]WSJ36248.1 AAA family ATPase [Streptomyces sp. NBC_01321]
MSGAPSPAGPPRPTPPIPILPYSRIVGQDELKVALELNFIAPDIGGVLVSGQRGTAKSTVVRAFALMSGGALPVTLPINATDDRVLGGWELDALMQGEPKRQPGLLEEAHKKGLLYVDEVNLLDDHIVNIILDVVSTGVLSVQREGLDTTAHVSFGLVGTMNPEEGSLRAQLLDRFGLMVPTAELGIEDRHRMIDAVLTFEEELRVEDSAWIRAAEQDNERLRGGLLVARDRLPRVRLDGKMIRLCAEAAARTGAVGQRGDLLVARAARALAAKDDARRVEPAHVRRVLPLALRHRRPESAHGSAFGWGQDEDAAVSDLFG